MPRPTARLPQVKLQLKAVKQKRDKTLWMQYWNDPCDETRNALCVAYMPLVRFIAERQKRKLPGFIDVNDLLSAGAIGLMDAIAKYDPNAGIQFETYCVTRILGAMLDSIRSLDWVPRSIRSRNNQHRRSHEALTAQLHREPTDEEMAAQMSVSLKELKDIQKNLKVNAQISIEAGASGEDGENMLRLEMLESPNTEAPARNLMLSEIRPIAETGLNANEKAVLNGYYFGNLSMKEIGVTLRLSESRICQIHKDLLWQLRKKFRAYESSPNLD